MNMSTRSRMSWSILLPNTLQVEFSRIESDSTTGTGTLDRGGSVDFGVTGCLLRVESAGVGCLGSGVGLCVSICTTCLLQRRKGGTTYIVGGIGEVVVDVDTGILLDEGVGHGGVVRCHLG